MNTKGIQLIAVAALVLAFAGGARAQEGEVSVSTEDGIGGAPATYVIGAYFGMGMAGAAGDGYTDVYYLDEDDKKVKFTAGGGAYFDLYLMPFLAVEAGIGFIGKGARAEGEVDSGWAQYDWEIRDRVVYMEIPLGAKLNIMNFQATVALGLWIGLTGQSKTKTEEDGTTVTQTEEWKGEEWDRVRRFNLGPRITLGYAIALGPVYLVPSITWMMHTINDFDEDEVREDLGITGDQEFEARAWNLMFNVGAEFGI